MVDPKQVPLDFSGKAKDYDRSHGDKTIKGQGCFRDQPTLFFEKPSQRATVKAEPLNPDIKSEGSLKTSLFLYGPCEVSSKSRP